MLCVQLCGDDKLCFVVMASSCVAITVVKLWCDDPDDKFCCDTNSVVMKNCVAMTRSAAMTSSVVIVSALL